MQTQTPEDAKRFLTRFISIFGAVACLILGGFVYLQYAIASTYFPSDKQVMASAILLVLATLGTYFVVCGAVGRFVLFGKAK